MAYPRRMEEDDERFNAIGEMAPPVEADPAIAKAWIPDAAKGETDWLEGLTMAEPDEGPSLPDPAQIRIVREPEEELPKPSARMASADPEFRPEPKRAPEPQADDDEGGYDWKRMLASLFGGNASVADLDKLRAAQKSQKLAERKYADESKYKKREDDRAQGKFELERDLLAPAKAKKLGADADKAGTEAASKELAVGSTKASAEARELVAQRFESTASKYRGSSNEMIRARAGDLERAAKNMRANTSMSGIAAFDAAKLANVDADDIARDAASKYREADGAQDNAETKRWHDAQIGNMSRDDARSAEHNINVKQTVQEKLNAEINDKDQAIQNMGKIAEIKNKVNTGFLTNLWSKWVGEPFDLNSADRNQMNALVARTFNKETKELAGSAVSNAEWERIAPQIPQMKDDDDVFRQKLAAAMEISNEILAKRKQQYQLKGGKPTDSSRTAQRAAAEGNKFADKIESTGAEGIDPQKAANAMRAKAILADPNESPAKKAKAKKWLQLNQ